MISVLKESDKLGFPLENCVFCHRHTQYWAIAKDVPVCKPCSVKHHEHNLPSKMEWLERGDTYVKGSRIKVQRQDPTIS